MVTASKNCKVEIIKPNGKVVPIPDEQLALPKVPKTVIESPEDSKPVKTHEAKIIHPRRRKVDAPVKPKLCKKADKDQVIKDDTGEEVDVDDNGCQQIKTVIKEPETPPEEPDDPQVVQT